MDEQKLIKLLKEHFPSKEDHEMLRSEVAGLRHEMESVKQELHSEIGGLKQDMIALRQEVREGFEEVKESIEDLKASSRALDKVLEQHPIPRIERLEAHAGLPPYISMPIEE